MEQWQLLGFNDRETYCTGTHADCIRWLNSTYKVTARGNRTGHKNLLPQPMLVVRTYSAPAQFDLKPERKPVKQVERHKWLDSELKVLEANMDKAPGDLKDIFPRHSVGSINARKTVLRAEIKKRIESDNKAYVGGKAVR